MMPTMGQPLKRKEQAKVDWVVLINYSDFTSNKVITRFRKSRLGHLGCLVSSIVSIFAVTASEVTVSCHY